MCLNDSSLRKSPQKQRPQTCSGHSHIDVNPHVHFVTDWWKCVCVGHHSESCHVWTCLSMVLSLRPVFLMLCVICLAACVFALAALFTCVRQHPQAPDRAPLSGQNVCVPTVFQRVRGCIVGVVCLRESKAVGIRACVCWFFTEFGWMWPRVRVQPGQSSLSLLSSGSH